jgi:hypothetical protein
VRTSTVIALGGACACGRKSVGGVGCSRLAYFVARHAHDLDGHVTVVAAHERK